MNALSAAIALGQQDYACFPCRADKSPFPGSHGFKDASTDAGELEALWRRYPGPLVGVATGAMSQTAVLDIDAKHAEAREWWAAHRPRLPVTRTHRTRSGGLHLIFRDHVDLKCSNSKIAKGVDVRASGGYVCWWPASGFPVLSDVPIAPWPEWLIPKPPPPQTKTRAESDDLRPLLRQALGILRTMANAAEGERNGVLYWCSCRVREMADAGKLDQLAQRQLLDNLHEAARRAGLSPQEITRTIRSAMRVAA